VALVDNVPALDRIVQNAAEASRLTKRLVAGKAHVVDGGAPEDYSLNQDDILALRARIQALLTPIKQDAQSL